VLDVKAIRENPEHARKALARRGMAESIDELLELDERRRELTARVEQLRAEQNRASKAIGKAQADERTKLIEEVSKVSSAIDRLEPELEEAERRLADALARVPNFPDESAPDGFTE
jgi:seryl-tRNA synthetase